tara:strand:- start:6435 stop:7040 length:606 start_codon:yes stop_codon:yes gene_type:complete
MIKLNLGCGGRLLKGYINVDMDSLEELKKRYPAQEFDDNIILKNYNLFNLPYENETVDLIRADGLIEHLSFLEESKFFYEIVRVLKKNGKLILSTIDFEKTILQWLNAKDNWNDFFKNDPESIKKEHWFGTYTYEQDNRWGYLTASLFGSQNGEGQFHKNCYSKDKFISICKKLKLEVLSINELRWKGNRDHILELNAKKL